MEGVALAVQFDTYLRPGELSELKVVQIISPPGAAAMGPSLRWGFNVRPSGEGGPPTKTGEHNEAILLDAEEEPATHVLQALKEMLSPSSLVFGFDAASCTAVFKTSLGAVKLATLGSTP